MTVTLESRDDVTLDAVRRVAWQGERLEISGPARDRMTTCREAFLRLLDDPDIVIYGVTSGYGQHARIRLSNPSRTESQK